MKLGPRVAIITTLLMAGVMWASTGAVLRVRRADLERDLERQMRDVADALAAGLEPVAPAKAFEVMKAREDWAASEDGPIRLEAVAGPGQRPNNSWAGLVEESTASGQPAGRLFFVEGRPPFYAMAIPLHNPAPDNPTRQVIAFLGARRDGGYIDTEVAASARRTVPLLLLGVVVFGVSIYFLLMSSVVKPLRRLVDAIDAVAKGTSRAPCSPSATTRSARWPTASTP